MAEKAPLLPFTVFGVVGRSVGILNLHLFPIMRMSLLVYLPVPALGIWAGPEHSHEAFAALAILCAFILGPFMAATLTIWASWYLHGPATGYRGYFLLAARMYFQVTATGLVVGLLAAATTLLLVVPGIVVTTLLWVAVPAAAMEWVQVRGVFECLDHSVRLTEGHRWRVLGVNLLSTIALAPAAALAGALVGGALSIPFVFAFPFIPAVDALTVHYAFAHWFGWAAASAAVCLVSVVTYHTLHFEKTLGSLEACPFEHESAA